jgi:cytochrome c oxidase subunit II
VTLPFLTRHTPLKRSSSLLLTGLVLILSGSGCQQRPSTDLTTTPSSLDPQGPAAANIAELWWIIFGMGTAVFLIVMLLLLVTVWQRRTAVASDPPNLRPANGAPWIFGGGVIAPFIILMIFLFFNMRSLAFLQRAAAAPDITIEVTGHMWWWDVHYIDEGFRTANEIHIPVGQRVQIRATSADVIHSFWVPQLQGKQDLTPGRVDTVWLEADEPGTYRGLCAEFCGAQHARMQIIVVALPPDRYEAWLERERRPAPDPDPDDEILHRGQQIFLGSACVYCHTVRGTNASGDVGPDLTHVASRRTLAAGILTNNHGNLAGWIIDPQNIKPGNLMPPTDLSGSDLQALLAYLNTLE